MIPLGESLDLRRAVLPGRLLEDLLLALGLLVVEVLRAQDGDESENTHDHHNQQRGCDDHLQTD